MTGRAPRQRGRADRGGPTGRVRRRWRLLAPARAGGLLGMLTAGVVFRLATTTPTFGLERVEAPSLRWTPAEAVSAAVNVPLGTNVFEIDTGPIAARLGELPAVERATASVGLPATLSLTVTEREPILAWRVGETSFLVDREGVLFATVDAATLRAAALPAILDDRAASPLALGVGDRLDPTDQDVATRLAALLPANIGSAASRLVVHLDDIDGWFLRGAGVGWQAVFGIYSPALRSTDIIPGQVQLLRSLLAGREERIDRVILADDRNGTYTVRQTPRP